MPVATNSDCSNCAPDSSMVAGYTDCLKEALKFLLEKEKLSPKHPVVAGLAMHLARPGARQSLRKLSTTTRTPKKVGVSASERQLHTVKNTSLVGRSRIAAIQKNKVTSSSSSERDTNTSDTESDEPSSTIDNVDEEPSSSSEPSSSRDINTELRRNLQNIVDNLQQAIDNSDDCDSSDEENDSDSEITEDPIYDVNENDLDTEIETILGDAELRRELVRLVYQGCDLIVAPQHPMVYPSPPCSPLYASIATPAQYLPHEHFEHVIEHLPNDRL